MEIITLIKGAVLVGSFLAGIGTIAFIISFVLLGNAIYKKHDTKGRYGVFLGASFVVLGIGSSLEEGLNEILIFLGTAGFLIGLVFIGLIIHAVIRKNGKTKQYAKLALIPFFIFIIGFAVADTSEASLNTDVNEVVEEAEHDDAENNETNDQEKEAQAERERLEKENERAEQKAAEKLKQEERDAAELKKKEAIEKADREKKEAEAKQAQKEQEKKDAAPLGQLKVHYINVGQADATLLEATDRDGKKSTLLIDTGDWNKTDALDYLHSVGVTAIDVMVGTHPHADHIGQMDKIINAMPVKEVWMSGDTSSSAVFQRILQAIDANDINYHEPRTGETFQIGDLAVDILGPASLTGNANDSSVSMRIVYGGVSFVFTGDAETKAEQTMVSSGMDLSADVLHLGHHGSDTSTIPTFFEKVNPKTAIYSAGNNSYGHPSPSVINRVKDANVDLYGTDIHGTIVITTDGKTYDVATNQTGTITAPKETKQAPKEKVVAEPTKAKSSGNSNCIDINTASATELQGIIHIGPARADLVIAGRPYERIENLTRVSGIAAGRLADIMAEGKACVK